MESQAITAGVLSAISDNVSQKLSGILGFAGMIVYLAGVIYLIVRKTNKADNLLVLTEHESRQMGTEPGSTSVNSLPREDIVSMQLPERSTTSEVD